MEGSIRVLVVDDHQVFRDALSRSLDALDEVEVVGSVGSAEEARVALAKDPDVVLLDVDLSDDVGGIQLCSQIKETNPDAHCLMLSGSRDEDALIAAVLAGAEGYVTKGIGLDELEMLIRQMHRGESLIDAATLRKVIASVRGAKGRPSTLLSPQEEKVLELLGQGMSNRDISLRLHLAEQTVKNYVSTIVGKLGVDNRLQAALLARDYVPEGLPPQKPRRSGT